MIIGALELACYYRGLESGLNGSTIAMLPSFVPELPDGTGSIMFYLTTTLCSPIDAFYFFYFYKLFVSVVLSFFKCINLVLTNLWTKGVTATGVVGRDVVKLLEEAIERDGVIYSSFFEKLKII
uniref:Uncharacterized protein n=1 Tax=Heterorhabditis bacteriophora TaxID=37862 RepID=A0A1I7WRZ3_HETBA